jgi:hypothetical protein
VSGLVLAQPTMAEIAANTTRDLKTVHFIKRIRVFFAFDKEAVSIMWAFIRVS